MIVINLNRLWLIEDFRADADTKNSDIAMAASFLYACIFISGICFANCLTTYCKDSDPSPLSAQLLCYSATCAADCALLDILVSCINIYYFWKNAPMSSVLKYFHVFQCNQWGFWGADTHRGLMFLSVLAKIILKCILLSKYKS